MASLVGWSRTVARRGPLRLAQCARARSRVGRRPRTPRFGLPGCRRGPRGAQRAGRSLRNQDGRRGRSGRVRRRARQTGDPCPQRGQWRNRLRWGRACRGSNVGVGRAHALRAVARHETVGGPVGEAAHGGLNERDRNVRPIADLLSLQQRHERALLELMRGQHVHQCYG